MTNLILTFKHYDTGLPCVTKIATESSGLYNVSDIETYAIEPGDMTRYTVSVNSQARLACAFVGRDPEDHSMGAVMAHRPNPRRTVLMLDWDGAAKSMTEETLTGWYQRSVLRHLASLALGIDAPEPECLRWRRGGYVAPVIEDHGRTLCNDKNEPIRRGDELHDFRGTRTFVWGGRAPQSTGSTGKVWTGETPEAVHEYYPGVFSLHWHDTAELTNPKPAVPAEPSHDDLDDEPAEDLEDTIDRLLFRRDVPAGDR